MCPVSYVFSPRLHSGTQMTAARVIPCRALSLRVTLLIGCFVRSLFLTSSANGSVNIPIARSDRGWSMQIWGFHISVRTNKVHFNEPIKVQVIENKLERTNFCLFISLCNQSHPQSYQHAHGFLKRCNTRLTHFTPPKDGDRRSYCQHQFLTNFFIVHAAAMFIFFCSAGNKWETCGILMAQPAV